MKFEMRDKTEEFVQFFKEGKGISYSGDRNLADYEIILEDLDITNSPSNHSMAIGTIHILRNHIFRVFLSPPPFLSIFHVLKTSKNCHFLTLFHPKQVLTEYMNGPPKQSVPKDYVESGQNT